ncbi:MAG TPA: T9SS type A sorting domain-containing protein [Flavobacteriales bacterium]|nr:T9SS type A sorting domain-containing protein [Flavobacteriales bacterium]HMR26724.1 T9SS type A sorting domain-containing protein [Flavobacteriales bacterium]
MSHWFSWLFRPLATTLVAGSLSATTMAQSNGWLADGTVWMEGYTCCPPGTPMCGESVKDRRVVDGDTVINGHLYKKVFQSSLSIEKECGVPPGTCDDTVFVDHHGVPSLFLRDTLGSMYRLLNGVEHLLYDMDLEVGDTVVQTVMWTFPSAVVLSIDSVVVQGSFRRRYQTGQFSLIEGVGWSGNGNGWFGFLQPPYLGYCSFWGFCYSVADTTYFPENGTACSLPTGIPTHVAGMTVPQVHPNPANELLFLDVPPDALHLRVVSATGAEVWRMEHPPTGRMTIPLRAFEAGAYLLEVRTGSAVSSQRFIVARP